MSRLGETDLWARYERFRDKKKLDLDPLVRYCTKPGCDGHMRGESLETTAKVQCPECSTWVCFLCREEWHGEGTSCEANLDKQLQGWAIANKDSVSVCPMCRTRIEKNKGCNHMTCGFCRYEFCWACGASATHADNHFGPMRGCGVRMMDETVKANSRKN